MKEKHKTIYVVGGTNGVGKSAFHRKLLQKETPYINADFIAKDLAGGKEPNKRQYQLAQEFSTAQIKNLLATGRPFAFENNMHEESNFKWLKETQEQEGYRIQFYYIGVDDLKITTQRIQERLKNGDHYVPADQVKERYEKGMQLLKQYYDMPDKLTLIDNSSNPYVCYQMEKGQTIFQAEKLPGWVQQYADAVEAKKTLSTTKEVAQPAPATEKKTEELKKDKDQEQSPRLIEKKRKGKQNGLTP